MHFSSSQPAQTEKPQPKPPEFLTGRAAFQKLYIAARGWARDAQPYRIESLTTEIPREGRKVSSLARVLRFCPATRGEALRMVGRRIARCAIARHNPGSEDNYSPTNASTQIFDIAFLKTDSDKALEVAQKHGGDKVLAKAPDTPILYMVDWSKPTGELIWHVIYGPTSTKPNSK